mgnify:CR=1 FL=1
MSREWFSVDKEGLAQVLGRQSKARAIAELIANAWDEPGVSEVKIGLMPIAGRQQVRITVEDDAPNGFADLTDSYVLFAPSKKKTEAETRGRFNVGEKLFLARCIEATIESTTGTVRFTKGGRVRSNVKRERGTLLTATMSMTRDELGEAELLIRQLIPPAYIVTKLAASPGEALTFVQPITREVAHAVFRTRLQTELANEDGVLRAVERETPVEVYRRLFENLDGGRSAMLYEMGIPVVAIDGPFSINVMQKVPLTLDRENVRPAFLRKLRVAVLDATHPLLQDDEPKAEWVTEALASAALDTVSNVMDQRFGKKRVSYDPSDPEASKRAASEGYTVVPGGALPAPVWERVRDAKAIKPAGQVTPTKYAEFSADGEDVTVPYAEWTGAMRSTFAKLQVLGEALLAARVGLSIRIVRRLQPADIAACYGKGGFLTLNLKRLGRDWFERGQDGLTVEHVDLLLHELGHEWCGDHLDKTYHDALTRLGARLALMVAQDPKLRKVLRREGAREVVS